MFEQQNFIYQQQFYNSNVQEKKKIGTIGNACGLAVIAFAVLGSLLSVILTFSDKFMLLYEESAEFSLAIYSLISVITFFLPFCFAYSFLKKRKIAGEIPFCAPKDKKDFFLLIPICVMVCIVGSIFTGYLSTFVDALFNIEFTQPDDVADYNTVSGILVSFFSTAIVPAFIEEFAIRGVVLQSLRRYGDKFAVIMSSFVFALMHGNMIQIPFAFIAGLGLGYAAVKTGSIWTGIIIHFINNSMAVVSMISMERLSDQGSTFFSMALYAVVFLIGFICLAAYCKKNNAFLRGLSNANSVYVKDSEKVKYFICNIPMIIAIILLVLETATYINVANG